jgi:endonuclease/exonuclease/phosphatase family metal-dependent hydrolase
VTAETRQTFITAGVVALIGVFITVLLLVTRGHSRAPDAPPGSDGPTAASQTPAPAPTEVVIDKSDGYALARKAEEILQKSCLPGPVDTTFNVVTYNIHSGHGHSGASLDRIADALRSLHADIVLLQEVDSGRSRTGRVNQPEALAARLDMVSAYGGNARLDGGVIGNAILTRYPLVSAKNSPLPNADGRQPRGLLHAVLKVDGIEVSVFDNHLDFHSDALKARQMAHAAQLIAADPLPGIVGGDLNSFPGSGAAAAARSVAQDPFPLVGRGSSATSPADRPRSRIDYLLHRGTGLTPLVTTVPPVLLSDHRPVFASYRLTGQRTCG